MKTYQLIVEDEFLILLKMQSAKADKSMKDFIIEAVKEKIEREGNNKPK